MKLGKLQRKWVNYLKEHPEEQITGSLGRIINNEKKLCCLGAAGILMKSCEWDGFKLREKSGDNHDGTLTRSYKKIGLRSHRGDIKDSPTRECLSCLNDDGIHTWVDIAYLIEAAPELFFTKSV